MFALLKIIVISFIFSLNSIANAEVVKSSAPDKYIVKKGDSLWDIANLYLDAPWMWSKIWKSNSGIKNSDLIYPGDTIQLQFEQGKPELFIAKRGSFGRYVKLTPHMRINPSENAIPVIHLSNIENILSNNIIFEEQDNLKSMPFITSIHNNQKFASYEDKVFIKGPVIENMDYDIYRKNKALKNPITGKHLGTIGVSIGKVRIEQKNDKYSVGKILKISKEIKAGDLLIPQQQKKMSAIFTPKAPDNNTNAVILSGLQSTTYFSRNDSIIISKGKQDGLIEGDILSVYNNPNTNNSNQLPLLYSGLIMVYKTYSNLSFALVLSSNQPLNKGFLVKSPKAFNL